MKTSLLMALMAMLMAVPALATLEASVAGFDATQKSFMVSIWNKGDQDYTDVSLTYRGIEYGVIVPLLKAGTFVTLPLESTPGKYSLEIMSGDAVFTQQIEFSMTQNQVKEAQELQAGILEQKQAQEQKEQQAQARFFAPEDNPVEPFQRASQIVEEIPTKTISVALLSSIVLLIFLIIIAVLSQHQKVRQFVQRRFSPKPGVRQLPAVQPQIAKQRLIQKRQIRERSFHAFDESQDRAAIERLKKIE